MSTEKTNGIVKTSGIIFMVLFMLMIIAPFVNEKLDIYAVGENIEKRTLEQKIPFALTKDYAFHFENYYKDNFGFRMLLIDWGSIYKTRLFRASPKPDKALFGKEGWLFYNNTEDQCIKSYTHNDLLSIDQLKARVKYWKTIMDSCAKSGIIYIKVFWPDKPTIYPELLPFSMKIQIRDTFSMMDQVIDYLKETRFPLKIVDVRRPLLEEKNKHQLYYKLDTHWNKYGGFLAYRELLKQIYPMLGVMPEKLEDFNIEWKTVHEGDLVNMMGLSSHTGLSDEAPEFTLKDQRRQYAELPAKGYPKDTRITWNKHCNNHYKVLIFHDSYIRSLAQFISLSFYEVMFMPDYYTPALVKQIQPDVVIDASVERYFGTN